ncbi:hypothetical protein GCM10023189_44610 [Nibrella saemangeumensis]|uniref:Mobilisation protein (MobC) n=1 Tax=Nibrella saemangeumensis TaxID=1084526 RepID=A0ABP8NFR3_9BACT
MESTKKKSGRRRKDEAESRSYKRVEVRFNQQEYDQLNQRKALTTAKDLSAFIRSLCLEQPLLVKPQQATADTRLLASIRDTRSQILRIGVNINQAVKHINSTTDYEDLRQKTAQLADSVAQLEVACRQAMGQLLTRQTREEVTSGSEDQQRE